MVFPLRVRIVVGLWRRWEAFCRDILGGGRVRGGLT